MRSVLLISIVISLMFVPKVNPSIGIGANPAEIFFSIGSGSGPQTQILYIINAGDEKANYEVSVEPQFSNLIRIKPSAFKLDPGEYIKVELSILPWRFPSTRELTFKVNVKAAPSSGPSEPGIGPGIKIPVYIDFKVPSTPVADALKYLRSVQAEDGGIGDFANSAWAVMAIAAAGEDPHKWRRGNGPSIVDYLKANIGKLDSNSAMDWARQALAATAAGEDPKNFAGVDCIKTLESLYKDGQLGDGGLLNDDFLGLMALISAGEKNQRIIDDVKTFIKAHQNPDGGWGYAVGVDSDVDDTAAALMALTAAGEPGNSESMMNAVNYLKGKLGEEGGFTSDSIPNSASDSWAIMALEVLNIDVLGDDWTRKGVNPIRHLLSLQNSDGSFSWSAGRDGEALWTSYAILALLGKPLILGFIFPVPEISNFNLTLLASTIITSKALALIRLKTEKRRFAGSVKLR